MTYLGVKLHLQICHNVYIPSYLSIVLFLKQILGVNDTFFLQYLHISGRLRRENYHVGG